MRTICAHYLRNPHVLQPSKCGDRALCYTKSAKDMKTLWIRTLLSVIGTALFLWVLLFLPAQSLTFWQAWIFWSIFSVAVTIISFYFLKKDPNFMESRLKAGPIAEKEKSQKIIQAFSSLFFMALLIIPGFDFRFHWSSVPLVLVIFGNACVLAGFWIVYLVFSENNFASATIQIGKGQRVISTGPYRFIRHPMYAGAGLMVGAMPLALGSYWAFIPVLLMGVGIVLRIFHEEKYLTKNLKGYGDYCRKVSYRIIPFVW